MRSEARDKLASVVWDDDKHKQIEVLINGISLATAETWICRELKIGETAIREHFAH